MTPTAPSGPVPSGAAPPTPVPPADGSPTELVRWIFGVHNSHDAHSVATLLAPDVVVRLPSRTLHGRRAVGECLGDLWAAVPDGALTVLGLAGEGETVFVRWRLTGTHRGAALGGIEPSGARLDIDGVDHVTVRDRTVVSTVVIYDQTRLARQLGLLPAEGSRLDVALRTAHNLRVRRHRP